MHIIKHQHLDFSLFASLHSLVCVYEKHAATLMISLTHENTGRNGKPRWERSDYKKN